LQALTPTTKGVDIMVEANSAYLCDNSPAMLELEGIVDRAVMVACAVTLLAGHRSYEVNDG
jgi:hypothetical protein